MVQPVAVGFLPAMNRSSPTLGADAQTALLLPCLSVPRSRYEPASHLALTDGFNAAFYVFIFVDPFYYVLRRDLMTEEKLFVTVGGENNRSK